MSSNTINASGYVPPNTVLTSALPITGQFTTVKPQHNISLNNDGSADFKGDIRFMGQSLHETLQAINDRLAILVPDPAKLEQYEALKQAYEEYKILERLLAD